MKLSHLYHRRFISRFMVLLVGLAFLGIAPAASDASERRPDAPTNLHVLATSVQAAVLTWSPPRVDSGITRYSIHRNGAWLTTVGSQSSAYVDISVQASSIYTYTVRAIGTDDDSSRASNAATVHIPVLPETVDIAPPSAPGTLMATPISSGVLLDWYDASDDSDITAYLIRRDGRAVAIVASAVLSYTDTSIQPPATPIYTVEAVDVMGHHSPPSNAVSVVLP
jgi:predicted phage tail protein